MSRAGPDTPAADGSGDVDEWDALARQNNRGAERRLQQLKEAAREIASDRLHIAVRLPAFERHYPSLLWHPTRWPTRDGYMPFRAFHAYEAEITAHRAEIRIDSAFAIAHVLGQKKDEPISEALRVDLTLARVPIA